VFIAVNCHSSQLLSIHYCRYTTKKANILY